MRRCQGVHAGRHEHQERGDISGTGAVFFFCPAAMLRGQQCEWQGEASFCMATGGGGEQMATLPWENGV